MLNEKRLVFGAFIPQGWTKPKGFIPWCADYPDTQTLELLATEIMPEYR